MTHAITTPSAEDCGCGWPHPATPVLLHRRLRPGLNPDTLSVFDDDRWDLSPGIFEGHAGGVSVNFAACPPALRPAVKHYLWEAINHPPPRTWRGSKTDHLSLRSIVIAYSLLRVFVEWLDSRGVTRFDQATPESLDRYLDHVAGLERSPETKADYLHEVRRLWCYRDRLPEHLRLPATPPWDGEETQDLIDRPPPAGRTPHPASTLTPCSHC
jgi:hypothetical protein